MKLPKPAERPTMYFIGVSTGKSMIMKLFPLWAAELGLDAEIKGIDIGIHADAEIYRECVAFIKDDPLSLGALVTTHKIDLYNAASDMFEYLDPYAKMLRELSSISKRDGKLQGHAKDPITSGKALDAFVPPDYWLKHKGEVFLMGAGGSALAIATHLTKEKHGRNVPSRIVISNRSEARLDSARRLLARIETSVPFDFRLCPEPRQNDAILHDLQPYSLVVNATGLGKDRPGSPLTDHAVFPENGLVWELNYRGELDFMHQALRQQAARRLHVEDGWIY